MSDDTPTLLLVDDDETFCRVLQKALNKRNFSVITAHNSDDAIQLASHHTPVYGVIDLNMPGDSGLTLIPKLKAIYPEIRIVVLTGYASIATAVEAIKLGATHYLTKPADADEIVTALHATEGDEKKEITEKPLAYNRLEWEHLQKVLTECDGNISEAARRLGMHRRTLQRKLQKRPSKSQ